MQEIIEAVDVELLKAELTPSKKIADTNKGHNELYVVTWQDSPNVTREIGRQRERAFRAGGGATGNAIDLDEYDTMENPYKQLVVWDPEAESIIGGYRFLLGNEAQFDENGQPILASSHQFCFSQKFIDDYLPHVLEVGRLFVAPEYQSSKAGAKSIFTMDNLWDGMVAIIMKNEHILYYFGKATVYPSYDKISRDLIYRFLWKHFEDEQHLLRPWPELDVMPDSNVELMDLVLNKDDVQEDFRNLKNGIRLRGTNLPPNINAFISVTPNLLMCGTAVNKLMNNIEDSALLIPFDEIYKEKKTRHVAAILRAQKSSLTQNIDQELESILVEKWMKRRSTYVKKLVTKRNRLARKNEED